MAVSAAELQHYLQGMDYPSWKDDLVRKAQENKAPLAVIDLLRNLPDREFASAADVGRAVGQIGT